MRSSNVSQILQHLSRTTLFLTALVGPARAQGPLRPPPGPAFALFRPAPALPPARPASFIHDGDSSPRAIPRTYWLEGGVAGGIGLGLVAAVLYGGLCLEESQSCTGTILGGFAVGGALGFVAGALVGGQFRKAARDTASAH